MTDTEIQALQERVITLEGQVSALAGALASVGHALDPTPTRQMQLRPEQVAGRDLTGAVRAVLGDKMPSRAAFYERVR